VHGRHSDQVKEAYGGKCHNSLFLAHFLMRLDAPYFIEPTWVPVSILYYIKRVRIA
jgi:hypothetical protein